jgi:transposase
MPIETKTWKHWTVKEMARLEEFRLAGLTRQQIAVELGRTFAGVALKLQELGIRRPRALDRWLAILSKPHRIKDVAKEAGVTVSAVKQAKRKLRRAGFDIPRALDVRPRHVYTPAEKALIRKLYPTHTAAEIAKQIHGSGRAALSIFRMAHKLGLRKWPHWEPEVIEQVRQSHSEGLNDVEIAARMGMARDQVHAIRYARLKLPPSKESIKEAGRRAVLKQQQTLGISNTGELRRYAYRKFARERGWPDDLRPRAVQILELLAIAGPLTRLQIAERIGWNCKRGPRHLLASNDAEGSYLAHLLKRCLVVYQGRYHPKHGHRGYPKRAAGTYMLSPAALDIVIQRAQPCEKTK